LRLTLRVVQTAPYPTLYIRDLERADHIFSHVLRGRVETSTGGWRGEVREGDVMVHPAGLPFSERAEGAGVHQWVAFEAETGDPAALGLLDRYPLPPVVPLGRRRADYVTAFDALEEAWLGAGGAGRELRVAGLAAHLFGILLDAWDDAGRPERPEGFGAPAAGRFAPLIAYMADHLHERLTRDDLARRACLHPGSFDRAFRQAHGAAPMRLLAEMRLSRARRLLETTDDTLDAVARACGLGDGPRLSRLFRARFGVAPGAHRLRAKSTTGGYVPPLSPGAAGPYNGANDHPNGGGNDEDA
jgi:AraC-like DNA-binding protein